MTSRHTRTRTRTWRHERQRTEHHRLLVRQRLPLQQRRGAELAVDDLAISRDKRRLHVASVDNVAARRVEELLVAQEAAVMPDPDDVHARTCGTSNDDDVSSVHMVDYIDG